jgi:hypothetical protein
LTPTPPGLTPETILQGEEFGFQVGQWLPELGELFLRAVNLQASEIGNLQGFLQDGAHILEMGQSARGILIAFPAMDLISAKTESIVQAFRLLIGFVDKPKAKTSKSLKPATVNFKVGHDCTAGVFCCHELLLSWDYVATEIK